MPLLALTLTSWGLLLAFTMLLVFEKRRGMRALPRMRAFLDRGFESLLRRTVHRVPPVDRDSFRQIFHYGVHCVLSWLLRLLEASQNQIRRVVRFNKRQAMVPPRPSPDSHLAEIQAHKAQSALSPEEKEVRKREALRGDAPVRRRKRRIEPQG